MQVTGHLVHYKILFLIIFLFLSSNQFAQVHPDKEIHSLLISGLNELINQNYDKSAQYFNELKSSYPKNPLGYIYLAVSEIVKNSDHKEQFNTSFIEKNLDEGRKLADKLYDDDDNNPWNIYYLALSKGFQAYYAALNQSWINAFTIGLSSLNLFEDCLEKDKKFYDAYTAIGTYKYWRSKKTESLNWMPFVEDETDLGLKLLEKAVASSTYTKHLAISSLLWIYLSKKEDDKALKLAKQVYSKYPNSKYFKWTLARAYENIDLNKSLEIYTELSAQYNNINDPNRINEINIKHIIAQLLNKRGDVQGALKLCNEILSIKLTPFATEKLERRLNRVKELKKELSK